MSSRARENNWWTNLFLAGLPVPMPCLTGQSTGHHWTCPLDTGLDYDNWLVVQLVSSPMCVHPELSMI